MYICFAEPKRQYGSFFNSAAAFVTRGKFCHVAIVFELHHEDNVVEHVECFIQRTNHPENDVVKLAKVENFEGWTCYRLQIDPTIEKEAYNYVCHRLQGMPYDRVGSIADFTFCWCFPMGYRTFSQSSKNKIYCSRLALVILQQCGLFLDQKSDAVSPNDLHRLIVNTKEIKCTEVTLYTSDIFNGKISEGCLIRVYTNEQKDLLLI